MEIMLFLSGNGECRHDWYVDEKGSDFHRVYYINGGKTSYEDDTNKFEFEKGKLYILPSNTRYVMSTDRNAPINCLHFHVKVFPPLDDKVHIIDCDGDCIISSMIKILACEQKRSKVLHEGMVRQLSALFSYLEAEGKISIKKDKDIDKSIKYIRSNIKNALSNEEISRYIGLEKSYFIRKFKKVTGESPQRFVMDTRLSAGIKYLSEGYSITETAEKCGFGDSKVFSKSFKSRYGILPSKFAKLKSFKM